MVSSCAVVLHLSHSPDYTYVHVCTLKRELILNATGCLLNLYVLFNLLGIWKEWFAAPLMHPDFYSNITKEVDQTWKEEHGKNVSDTVKEYLLTYLGEPLHRLIRYILCMHI